MKSYEASEVSPFWEASPQFIGMLSHFSHVQLFVTPWTVAHQAPLSMDSPGKNTGVGSCPPPGDLPDQGIKPTSLMSPALADGFFTTSTTWEAPKLLG